MTNHKNLGARVGLRTLYSRLDESQKEVLQALASSEEPLFAEQVAEITNRSLSFAQSSLTKLNDRCWVSYTPAVHPKTGKPQRLFSIANADVRQVIEE